MSETDALIAKLAAAAPGGFVPGGQRLRWGLGVMAAAVILPVGLFLAVAGTRPDLGAAWANPVVPFKTFLPMVTCALALMLAIRLSRPEARAGLLAWLFALPAGVAAALWLGAFATRPASDRFAEVGFVSLAECLGLIVLLAIVPTTVALRLLQQGASTSPRLSGALAGLTAASGAATGYSLFCTRDNPLFFVTWYGAAIAAVTLTAALIGARKLRW